MNIHINKDKIRKIQSNGINLALCISTIALIAVFDTKYTHFIKKIVDLNDTKSLTTSDIKEKIYESDKLTDEDKKYLYNEDFLNDVLETINDSTYLKLNLKLSFNNIEIVDYKKSFGFKGCVGFYNFLMPNKIFIKYYNGTHDRDTLSHEYVHLCEANTTRYDLIIESATEIISSEYFASSRINCYIKEIKLLKKLMETIGSRPIWEYVFTGDFTMIEERVKPYLSSEDYHSFLYCLKIRDNENEYSMLDSLIDKLYSAIYNEDISTNPIITMITTDYPYLIRHYFNPDLSHVSCYSIYGNLDENLIFVKPISEKEKVFKK